MGTPILLVSIGTPTPPIPPIPLIRARQTTQNVTVGGIIGIRCVGVLTKNVVGMRTPIEQVPPIRGR